MKLTVKPFDKDLRNRRILPYNPLYAEIFGIVERFITNHLPNLDLEHIGSTSVPGLGAKPMIDILILCDMPDYPRVLNGLEGLGFHIHGSTKFDTPEKPIRVGNLDYKGDAYNIVFHLTPNRSECHRNNVFFRETMKSKPDLAKQYETIKKEALSKGLADSAAYNDYKNDFIQSVLSKQ